MSKLVLTIDTSYLRDWGAREGLREMLQNGRDAEIQYDAPLTVRYREDKATLFIENEGASIPLKALLIGFSSKRDDSRLAGKYGEGLAFGILALVRDGHKVRIHTGPEVWTASIEPHEQVGQDVLVFHIEGNRKDRGRVVIEIGNIGKETYEALPEHFLFLSKEKGNRIETHKGALLLDTKYAGNIYVKGIYVTKDPKLTFGYDFTEAETDRDRKMLRSYDLENESRGVWREALVTRPDLVANFIDLLHNRAKDVEGVESWSASYLPEEAKQAVAADFASRFGENATPVETLADSAEIEHLGRRGVIVSKPLRAVLETILGTTDQVRAKLREEAQHLYGWHELTIPEKNILRDAICLVNGVTPTTLEDIDITDFRDENIDGLFRDGRILLAHRILSDRKLTRRVLIHEVAHRNGGDGEKSHVSEMERIHAEIEENLITGRA